MPPVHNTGCIVLLEMALQQNYSYLSTPHIGQVNDAESSLNLTTRNLTPGQCVEIVYLIMVAAVGSIGNVLLILVVSKYKKLRTSDNAFVANVAVADLLITAYLLPMVIANNIFQRQMFGPILCNINGCLLLVGAGVSISSLQFLAINRYVAICHKNRLHSLFCRRNTALLICAVWIYVTVGVTPSLYGWGIVKYVQKLHMCTFYHAESLSYTLVVIIFGILVPAIVTFGCYTKIYIAVRVSRHRARGRTLQGQVSFAHALQRERQLLVSFAVFLLFVLFWLPFSIAALADRQDTLYQGMWRAVTWLGLSNSSINWFVYGAFNKNFKRAYIASFPCIKMR